MTLRQSVGAAVNRLLRPMRMQLVPLMDYEVVTLNDRLRRFRADHRHIALPPRETDIRPEIIVTCYRHADYLREAMLSALGRGVPVTVVNDNSPDHSAAVLDELAREHEFRRIDNPANLKQWGSINKAVETSSNNLFIILNDDDVFLPYTVSTILDFWSNPPDGVRLLGGDRTIFHRSEDLLLDIYPDRLPRLPGPRIFTPDEIETFTDPGQLDMNMTSMSFLRSAWEACGRFKPYEERVFPVEDRDFQLRVGLICPVAVFGFPLTMYRRGTTVWRMTD